MSTSKIQREGVTVVCACGCGKNFRAFPTYKRKTEGGGLRIPEYKRGHHPNCRKNQTGNIPVWNSGLTKEDHPSIKRMGFQPGHRPFCDWSHVNQLLRSHLDVRQRWLQAKLGQVAWNKGKTCDEYPNGIKSGAEHKNWKGGHGGIRDTAEWQRLRTQILRRDKWTCQSCSDHNHKGRGSRIELEVHHIISVCENPALALETQNLVTLCAHCHRRTHNYGSKAVKQRGNSTQ